MAARKRSSNTDTGRRSPSASVKYEAVLWGVLAFSLILFISNFGIAGKAGNFISNIFFGLFGMIAYIFPIILFAGTAFMIANRNNTIAVIKITASVFFVIFTCMFLELIGGDGMAKSPFDSYAWAVEHRYGGGITGGLLVFVIRSTLGTISAYIIDIIVLIICMILITERSLWKRIQSGGKKVYVSARKETARQREEHLARRQRRIDNKVSGVCLDTSIKNARKQEPSDAISEIRPDPVFAQSFPIHVMGQKSVDTETVKMPGQAAVGMDFQDSLPPLQRKMPDLNDNIIPIASQTMTQTPDLSESIPVMRQTPDFSEKIPVMRQTPDLSEKIPVMGQTPDLSETVPVQESQQKKVSPAVERAEDILARTSDLFSELLPDTGAMGRQAGDLSLNDGYGPAAAVDSSMPDVEPESLYPPAEADTKGSGDDMAESDTFTEDADPYQEIHAGKSVLLPDDEPLREEVSGNQALADDIPDITRGIVNTGRLSPEDLFPDGPEMVDEAPPVVSSGRIAVTPLKLSDEETDSDISQTASGTAPEDLRLSYVTDAGISPELFSGLDETGLTEPDASQSVSEQPAYEPVDTEAVLSSGNSAPDDLREPAGSGSDAGAVPDIQPEAPLSDGWAGQDDYYAGDAASETGYEYENNPKQAQETDSTGMQAADRHTGSQKLTQPLREQKPQPVTHTTHANPKQSAQEAAAGAADAAIAMRQARPLVKRRHVFPLLNLLKKGDPDQTGDSRQHLQETALKLQQTLKNFGVNVTILNVSCGPAVTRYEIQPEMGVKVSKIVNLADDIKLNLAAADIRIEAPIPGKAAIGIEVPNKENVTVMFRDLIESEEFQRHTSPCAFAVGRDIAGQVVVTDICKMPHLLIAGATGAGKSVCINTIIMSIIYKADPDDVKLIMIDPKVVELSVYNGIPHLLLPVVTDPKKAAGSLHWAVAEMMDRYQKFASYGVRDIKGYNAKIRQISHLPDEGKPEKMPYIVIIVDELADLMMVAPGDVEDAICRLAQLARAAGIHLIIATQRPSVNVITGLIKANMPSRIAFSVTSGIDSRTILDMNGAEKLLGKGDMLFYPQGLQKPVRVQGAFVSDGEVSDVVEFLTEQNGVAGYNKELEEKVANAASGAAGGSTAAPEDSRDAYFADAARLLMDKEKASVSMLQRYFKIGFNRAARIMDQLEEAGVVGPEEGTKPRKILMSPEQFAQYEEECL